MIPLSSVALFGLGVGLRNVGLGLIVSSIITSAEIVALGVTNPWVYAISILEMLFAILILWNSV